MSHRSVAVDERTELRAVENHETLRNRSVAIAGPLSSRPHALVHGEDPWAVSDVLAEWVTSEEVAEHPFVEAALAQRGVEAAPTPPVDGREAQVDR